MGVSDGIHWFDAIIFVVLLLVAWDLLWLYERRAAKKWTEKMMKETDAEFYEWEEKNSREK